MTVRKYHRSESEDIWPPSSYRRRLLGKDGIRRGGTSEEAYQRAAQELRDFHRAQSLDVILEEDGTHHPAGVAPALGGLRKQTKAIMRLADLATLDIDDEDDTSSHDDRDHGSSSHGDDGGDEWKEQQPHAASAQDHHCPHSWGHFHDDDDHAYDGAGRHFLMTSRRISYRSSHSRREKRRTFQR